MGIAVCAYKLIRRWNNMVGIVCGQCDKFGTVDEMRGHAPKGICPNVDKHIQGNGLADDSRIPELPADSVTEPTSAHPSPSKGLMEATSDTANPPKLYLIDTIDNNGHPLTKLIEIKDEDE